jgi:hypothetical protein
MKVVFQKSQNKKKITVVSLALSSLRLVLSPGAHKTALRFCCQESKSSSTTNIATDTIEPQAT